MEPIRLRRSLVLAPALALALLIGACETPARSPVVAPTPREPAAVEEIAPAAEATPGDEATPVVEVAPGQEATPGQEAVPAEEEERLGDTGDWQTTTFENVTVRYPAQFAGSVEATDVATPPNQSETQLGDEALARIHFSFVDYVPGEPVSVDRSEQPFPAQILVYPTEAFANYEAPSDDEFGFSAEFAKLQALLEARPNLAEQEHLPFLPPVAANQIFHAVESYLEFDGGAGIRYLTSYGDLTLADDQGTATTEGGTAPAGGAEGTVPAGTGIGEGLTPVTEGQLIYTFQGLTDDGRYFVSATFPIHTGVLPTEMPEDLNLNQWVVTADTYFADLRTQFGEMNPGGFTPSLEVLDQIITTLQIE